MSLNIDANSLLTIKGSSTATLREQDILIPPIIVESSFLANTENVKATILDNGSVKLEDSKGVGNKLIDFRLVFPPESQQKAGFKPGDTLDFKVKEGSVIIKKIDRQKDDSFKNPTLDNNTPIPPAWMLQAFTGVPDIRGFIQSGPRSMRKIVETANKWGLETKNIKNVLDFGCGCGRILGRWKEHNHVTMTGCDLHNEAIDWCKQHYKGYNFYNGTELPPSPSKDGTFDLVYAISVLTHLDEEHQNAWLQEWKRVTKPGGIVIATFRGEDFVERVIKAEKRKSMILKEIMHGKGISFQERPGWEGVFESFYGGTYHSRDYIKKEWGKHFEILEMLDSGEFINRQNAAIMRKK